MVHKSGCLVQIYELIPDLLSEVIQSSFLTVIHIHSKTLAKITSLVFFLFYYKAKINIKIV